MNKCGLAINAEKRTRKIVAAEDDVVTVKQQSAFVRPSILLLIRAWGYALLP